MKIEKQQLPRGYERIIYICEHCGARIGRISLHNDNIIGMKTAPHFPSCPVCSSTYEENKSTLSRIYGVST